MQIGLSSIPSQAGYGFVTRQSSSFACGRASRFQINRSRVSAQVQIKIPRPAQNNKPISHDDGYYSSSLKIHLSNLDKLFEKQKQNQSQTQPSSSPRPPRPPPAADSPDNSDIYAFFQREKGLLAAGLINWRHRIWPVKKAVDEEMSPRYNLQEMLAANPYLLSPRDPSPRNNLGNRWMEYHGSNDWAGLLDPLDENLRREIVRYGEFVQAAYHAFSHESSGEDPNVVLPDSSYKVTKNLYATSSIALPRWVEDVAPGWMTQRTSSIGYIAVCDDKKEIERMGRRDIVIALRGTSTCLEWAENLRDLLVRIDDDEKEEQVEDVGEKDQSSSSSRKQMRGKQLQSKVECGFWSLYKTGSDGVPSLSESVTQEVGRLMELYKGEKLSITVTGHSLGAALSVLAADELSRIKFPNQLTPPPPIAVFSFGGPRVGNRGFANRIKEKGIVKVLRVVNSQDMITRVPGMFVSEELDHKLRAEKLSGGSGGTQTDLFSSGNEGNKEDSKDTSIGVGVGVKLGSMVLDMLDNNMPWAYSHVGCELRVDSKRSPFLKPNADVACCHDLEAYLHLVDGFLAPDCPFRKNAKRSIAKLQHEQGSNCKQVYTRKVAMALDMSQLHHQQAQSGVAVANHISNCLPSPS